MRQRTIILIDGSNFYYKLKDLKLNNLLKLDFRKFVNLLVNEDKLIEASYFIGRIRQDKTKKTAQLFANQQKLLASLKKSGIKYKLGYLLKNDGIYHEKGVDVQIATDILIATYEKKCDKLIIVSSDTDLAPAIKKAREKKIYVQYIGFAHMPSKAMRNFCSSTRLLKREEIETLIQE